MKLKELLSHLKYAYLGEHEIQPVIVSNKLTPMEEEKLIEVLKDYKAAISCTIADINGLSPLTCMHHILLEEDSKPTREPQQRLNPPLMEVVKKKIQKLMDASMIYLISNSRWVNPVNVMPKKTRITIAKNDDGAHQCSKWVESLYRL